MHTQTLAKTLLADERQTCCLLQKWHHVSNSIWTHSQTSPRAVWVEWKVKLWPKLWCYWNTRVHFLNASCCLRMHHPRFLLSHIRTQIFPEQNCFFYLCPFTKRVSEQQAFLPLFISHLLSRRCTSRWVWLLSLSREFHPTTLPPLSQTHFSRFPFEDWGYFIFSLPFHFLGLAWQGSVWLTVKCWTLWDWNSDTWNFSFEVTEYKKFLGRNKISYMSELDLWFYCDGFTYQFDLISVLFRHFLHLNMAGKLDSCEFCYMCQTTIQ